MMRVQLLDRLRNWPGRRTANDSLKRLRRSALDLLPSACLSQCSRVITEAHPSCRWEAIAPDCLSSIIDRVAHDRPSRAESLRVFEGNLVIDPYSTLLLADGQILWGSKDSIGREREPFLSSLLRKPKRVFEEVISLRGLFENNYFHFFYDTLVKLMLCEQHLAPDVPVIVSETLFRQPFFADCLKMGVFGSRPICTQGSHELIGARRIYVPSPAEPDPEHLRTMAQRFGADRLPKGPELKLYVARGKKAVNKRRLRNEGELYQELEKRGFRFFDAQEHDLPTQIATFARANFIIAPHGAGLTNVIWRQDAPLTVVELVNPSMHTLDMAYLSATLGHRHHMVDNLGDRGEPLRSSAMADIDPVLSMVDAELSQ